MQDWIVYMCLPWYKAHYKQQSKFPFFFSWHLLYSTIAKPNWVLLQTFVSSHHTIGHVVCQLSTQSVSLLLASRSTRIQRCHTLMWIMLPIYWWQNHNPNKEMIRTGQINASWFHPPTLFATIVLVIVSKAIVVKRVGGDQEVVICSVLGIICFVRIVVLSSINWKHYQHLCFL